MTNKKAISTKLLNSLDNLTKTNLTDNTYSSHLLQNKGTFEGKCNDTWRSHNSFSLYSPPHEPLNYPVFQWYSAISITKDNTDNLQSNHQKWIYSCVNMDQLQNSM